MESAVPNEAMLPLARSRVYSFLAACFRYPDAESLAEISGHEERTTFTYACAQLAEEKDYRSLRRYCGGLPASRDIDLEKLEDAYQEVFGHTISKHCPPYETEYGNVHLFQQSDVLADLGGFYNAFGVAPREGKERLDHISIQLEFLYLVTFKEARALEEGKTEEAEICREAQAAFFEDHFARWAPIFAKRLERKDPEGIYGEAARLLDDFLEAEKKRLTAEPELVPDVSRGEFLPTIPDEWDSSDWQRDECSASDKN